MFDFFKGKKYYTQQKEYIKYVFEQMKVNDVNYFKDKYLEIRRTIKNEDDLKKQASDFLSI